MQKFFIKFNFYKKDESCDGNRFKIIIDSVDVSFNSFAVRFDIVLIDLILIMVDAKLLRADRS